MAVRSDEGTYTLGNDKRLGNGKMGEGWGIKKNLCDGVLVLELKVTFRREGNEKKIQRIRKTR